MPQSLFNEVAGLHERRRGTRLPKGTYLLSGLVYHRESGTPFQSRPTAGRWFYYRNEEWGRSRRMLYAARKLSRAALTPPGGNQPVFASIPKALLERMVIGEVMKLLSDEHLIDQSIAADEERRASGHSALHDAYYKKQAEINEAEAGLERFLDAFASGVLALSTATTRKHHQLEDRIRRLEAEATVLRGQLEQVEPRPERIDRLKAALAELPEILQNAQPAQQFAALRAIVNRPSAAHRDNRRAWIILNRADGLSQTETARKVGVRQSVVVQWEQRFRKAGIAGLSDAKGRGRKPRIASQIRGNLLSFRLINVQLARQQRWIVSLKALPYLLPSQRH